MADTKWINGGTNPQKSGEYYIVIEAQHDMLDVKKGDIEVMSDYYDSVYGAFDTLGKDCTAWKVLCWCEIERPSVPKEYADRVRWFLGERVGDCK